MNNINSLKKILVVLIICIIWFCSIYYIIFSNIKNKNEQTGRLISELNAQVKKQENSLLVERMIKNADSNINLIDSSIIAKDGDVGFIENLERIARESGLEMTIQSLIFEDDPSFASTTLTSLKITAKTKGAWLGSYKFLAHMESLPFKIKINKFVLVKNISDADSEIKNAEPSLWESTFEIRVLKYK
ncbi:MAG: hypothetical protein UT65_C0024G0002 [Parcubacteria group bacterium GW2011_GWF2_39_8b]|uniref:Uncharacterized protein n=1 Tax=Candidatus Zambryskibacteria bacterium RIFCSPLOWO2_12_39_8 TaxID=1802774 RepID=A0A1G2UW49_9BACT|nr:MAG: hypothetical protein UT65_C0024G0002 [Parcubacteria group bacterium GW2011_GWF2_39_8b]KKR45804.1 MAG: hypothetical protein UT81_C0006G0029 [Parcubacteria group bacterium GW2011_GWA2_40_14]OHB08684.1 MAG: hypothetical protein A2W64_02150 [Candidatus Zambryskibacteria bacterium RIFCSPLOWO2_02_39_10]OHB09681.1 MAG: hypothetical protein A3I21_00245 [Candidatus Zambryskibacteria bacterium RIFCSPLOWO2_02_FULL_39_69]OHB13578.1 MAG: hypothetical protein A2Y49_03290 [Candidatus Zambryskibacteria